MTDICTSPVTVVICAYTMKRWDDLLAAVGAMSEQTVQPERTLVIIDYNDELYERLKAEVQASAAVDVIPNQRTRGLSGARNTAIEQNTSEIMAFLDDDACPAPDWLEHLVGPFSMPTVHVTGGRAVPRWPVRRPWWFPPEFDWVVGSTYLGMPVADDDVRNVHGASMAFRARVFETVGGFQEHLGRVGTLPVGCEETEMCIRVTQQIPNSRIRFSPASTVLHRVTEDRVHPRYFLSRCYAEGISKAEIGLLVGKSESTSDERSYVKKTLTAAAWLGVRQGLRGDLSAFGRVLAILIGLVTTILGYTSARGRHSLRTAPTPVPIATPSAHPVSTSQTPSIGIWCPRLDLVTGDIHALDAPVGAHGSVRALVRAGRRTLGYVTLDRPATDVSHSELLELARLKFPDALTDAHDVAYSTAGRHLPLVTVAVCTRDRASMLPACLDALTGLTYPSIEILIVDNAPLDSSTREVVETYGLKDARFRYVVEPRAGLSNARNRAALEARGEYLAYTDDDVRAEPDWVDALMAGFERDPSIACVTGLVCTASLTTRAELYFDSRTPAWSTNFVARTYDLGANRGDGPQFPYAAGVFGAGANFAVRRGAVIDMGGFDPALGAGSLTRGGEDLDIFVRLLQSGHALRYVPDAVVWHSHRASDADLVKQMYGYGTGLSAYLTKLLMSPRTRADVARKFITGLLRFQSIHRNTEQRLANVDPPAGASRSEIRGVLAGPWLYLRARHRARRQGDQDFIGSR